MNKSAIRKKIFQLRKKKYFKSESISPDKILKFLDRKKIKKKIIGGYYPYNYEVDAIKILEKFEKLGYEISLPKIKNNTQMDFFRWSPKDPLSINKYGIPEPTSDKIIYPSILLVPLVAYDKHCNRLGYGGGFYDRYIKKMKKNKKIVTIGLAYSFQKVKQVPINKYDMRLNYIATNEKI